ncbi:LytTR family DNA-binding domain-containing protein [Algoriphagus sp. Y33]|uniref:LytR/AlgR family response regulator transcription factor n=1 Tax=Algoriphagus sp. Y33 TaxID=2772483 RepID=UPI00178200B8|nr:LytTR family DNA-binding domain-containing protein [Algoriphagus sp. Y33]
MITIAIIDDEQHCIDRVTAFLEPYGNQIRRLCFYTADEAVKGIDSLCPDIVFLDVQLYDKTGFDVLSAISFTDFCLIFTTAYEQYAIDAFKFSAIDYLLKPIDREDFDKAMRKAIKKVEQAQLNERINVLLGHLSPANIPKKIGIPSREGFSFLDISEIVRCEANVNYTELFTKDGKKHTVSKTLKHFEEILTTYGFFRIHNSHLINLSYVKGYAKSGYVTLIDNLKLEISVRRKDAFIKACNGFLSI